MTRDPRKRIVKAIRAGNAAFEPPEAAGCMPVAGSRVPVFASGFKYVKATPIKRGIQFQWGYPGIGFGEVYVSTDRAGKWVAETECMGPHFCSAMLSAWIRGIVK